MAYISDKWTDANQNKVADLYFFDRGSWSLAFQTG